MNRSLDHPAARRPDRDTIHDTPADQEVIATGDGRASATGGRATPGQVPAAPDPVPPFRVRQLTIEDGLALASWSSPAAWHVEDALEPPEPDEGYWAVVDSADTPLGYCCLGAAARVPGQPADQWLLDVAIGIRPQLAGRGWSGELGRAAIAYARTVAQDRRLRTTVPQWNDPGRHAARQAGFTSLGIRPYHQRRYEVFEQAT